MNYIVCSSIRRVTHRRSPSLPTFDTIRPRAADRSKPPNNNAHNCKTAKQEEDGFPKKVFCRDLVRMETPRFLTMEKNLQQQETQMFGKRKRQTHQTRMGEVESGQEREAKTARREHEALGAHVVNAMDYWEEEEEEAEVGARPFFSSAFRGVSWKPFHVQ